MGYWKKNSSVPEMTCREFIEFLDDYVESKQAADVRAAFERHLEECPDCVEYLATYRATIEMAREACPGDPSSPVPEDAPEDLIRAILNSRPPEP